MKTATFRYRCRQCGQVFDEQSTGVPYAQTLLADTVFDFKHADDPEIGDRPALLTMHYCGDTLQNESTGVADLIGFIVKDE